MLTAAPVSKNATIKMWNLSICWTVGAWTWKQNRNNFSFQLIIASERGGVYTLHETINLYVWLWHISRFAVVVHLSFFAFNVWLITFFRNLKHFLGIKIFILELFCISWNIHIVVGTPHRIKLKSSAFLFI